jgi:Trypsin
MHLISKIVATMCFALLLIPLRSAAEQVLPLKISMSALEAATSKVHSRFLDVAKNADQNGTTGLLFTVSEFPFSGIVFVDGIQECTGSLVAPNVVLTAAHCFCRKSYVFDSFYEDAKSCREANLALSKKVSVYFPVAGMFHSTADIELNEDYHYPDIKPSEAKRLLADLALVRLDSPVPVVPVKLFNDGNFGTFVGLGFGHARIAPSDSSVPVQAQAYDYLGTAVFASPLQNCPKLSYSDLYCSEFSRQGLTNTSNQGNSLPCPGDSGGAVLSLDKNGMPLIVAVESAVDENTECQFNSGLAFFTSLKPHADWIRKFVSRYPAETVTTVSSCYEGFILTPEKEKTFIEIGPFQTHMTSTVLRYYHSDENAYIPNSCTSLQNEPRMLSCLTNKGDTLRLDAFGFVAAEVVFCESPRK